MPVLRRRTGRSSIFRSGLRSSLRTGRAAAGYPCHGRTRRQRPGDDPRGPDRACRSTRRPARRGDLYQTIPPIDGFIQQEPSEGAPASESTQVWIFFDDRNVYVSARCFDSDPDRDVVTEMRRDNNNITQNESFTVVFDTFLDRRNGLFFQTTPLGALRDQAIVDDVLNVNWNTVWDVRTGVFEGGWTAEFVIPFKSLRYPDPGHRSGASTSGES